MNADRYVLGWTREDGTREVASRSVLTHDMIEKLAANRNAEANGSLYFPVPEADAAAWKAAAEPAVVEMMTGPDGRAVPARLVRPQQKLEDQTVRGLVEKARMMRAAMIDFKVAAFDDVETFLGLLAAQYGVDRKGKRGGVTLTSYDGMAKIELSVMDSVALGPEITIARELIDQCIARWSNGAASEIQMLVNDAFRVGQTGGLQADRVLSLLRLEITDPQWIEAMNAIRDAIRKQQSKAYLRFHERGGADAEWSQISLNMSAL